MPSQNSNFKLTALMLLVGFILCLGSVALAQEQASEAQRTESETVAIVAFPPGEILPQVERTRSFIRRSEEMAASGFPTEDLEAQLLELQNRYEALKARTERRLEGLVPPGLIFDLQSAWKAESVAAKISQRTPAKRSEALAGILENVGSLLQRWQLTREGEAELGLPDPVVAEVEKTIDELTALRKTLQDRWVEVISIQDGYSQLLVSYDQMIGLVEERAEDTRARLFSLDSPPLWVVLASGEEDSPAFEQLIETWQTSFVSTAEYVRTYPERLVIEAVIFLVLLLFMLAVRRRAREWNGDPNLQAASVVLERPVSQALLVTLVLSGIFLHVMAPRAFLTLVSCLGLIPLIRLVPGLIEPAFRSVVYLLGVLFVIDQVSLLSLPGSLIHRLLITLSTCLGMGICALFLRQLHRKGTADSRWSQSLRLALRVSVWVFIASLILNILGAVFLADLLTTGLLHSAYLALVLLIAVTIIDSCLQVFVRTPTAQRFHIFRNHGDLILKRASRALAVGSFLIWVWGSLKAYWMEKPLFDAVGTVLTASAKLGTIEISLGFVLSFVFCVWLSFVISRFVRFVLEEDIYPRVKLPRGVPGAVSTITHYIILFLGFLVAFGAAGFDMSRFTILAGAFGVGIGFGLQNIVNNFISGLILLFERPIQIGDKVQVGDLFGEVRHIGIRASVVQTWEGAEVIVPNGNLISEAVVNWTLTDQVRRVDVSVGVEYGTEPERVLELLLEVARKHPKVLGDPEPSSLFLGFGESSLDFSLRAWTRFDNYRVVRSELHVGINRALADAGIVIPFPQRDLHVRSVGPEVKDIISQEEGYRPSGKPDSNED